MNPTRDPEPSAVDDPQLANLLELLDAVSEGVEGVDALDDLTGGSAGAQENRTIAQGRAHLARREAREGRSAMAELRREARELAAHARAVRTGSTRPAAGRQGDPELLAAARAINRDRRSADQRATRPQHLAERALSAHASTCWARLALVEDAEVVAWSAGELPSELITTIENGPQAAVLSGAGPIEITPDDAQWPAVAAALVAAGLYSIATTPVGREPAHGALVLAGARVFDDDDRLLAHRLAEHTAAALSGDTSDHDAASAAIDGARAVLGTHLELPVDDAFDVLLDTAAAVEEPVLVVARRLLAALVPRAPVDDPPAREPATLHRAVTYIDRHAADSISIDDLTRAAGIGARGLQHLFRYHRGLTPMEYLRQVRLDRAHAELLAVRPGSVTTVGAIAARWHFTNPGRFSVAYRERFGTSPSTTLKS